MKNIQDEFIGIRIHYKNIPDSLKSSDPLINYFIKSDFIYLFGSLLDYLDRYCWLIPFDAFVLNQWDDDDGRNFYPDFFYNAARLEEKLNNFNTIRYKWGGGWYCIDDHRFFIEYSEHFSYNQGIFIGFYEFPKDLMSYIKRIIDSYIMKECLPKKGSRRSESEKIALVIFNGTYENDYWDFYSRETFLIKCLKTILEKYSEFFIEKIKFGKADY